MAHISTPTIDRPMGDGPTLRRPSAAERRSALAVLLTGRDAPNQPAVDHFLNFADQQQLSLDGLWSAYDGQTPLFSALIIPGSGRTAVLFSAPISSEQLKPTAVGLVRHVVDQQPPESIRLIQVLLEPSQKREEQMLVEAGFHRLAGLTYMRRSCMNRGPTAPPAEVSDDTAKGFITCDGRRLDRISWDEDHHDAFARAIDASYEDTLDCPGLVGVRTMDDIIAGHKAVGRFEPGLWSAYYDGDEPAAVLLLNPLIDRHELELVYLGLSPRYRGKGLATSLMHHAFAQAGARNDTGIHLAVDQANAPALQLYQRLGFRATGRKVAMIDVLK